MSYVLEFRLEGLPKIYSNGRHGSWKARWAAANKWKKAVGLAVLGKKPDKPLKKAKVTLTRSSSQCPDYDGLVISFKNVIDGLVQSGIVIDDKMNVLSSEYKWEKGSPGKGFITVRVEAV